MHNLIELPKGKRVQDVLPHFAGMSRKEFPAIGTPCTICPSCCKPFTAARKPRLIIRLYPIQFLVPIAFQYRLCGPCARKCRATGSERDGVLAAIELFIEGLSGGNHGD